MRLKYLKEADWGSTCCPMPEAVPLKTAISVLNEADGEAKGLAKATHATQNGLHPADVQSSRSISSAYTKGDTCFPEPSMMLSVV